MKMTGAEILAHVLMEQKVDTIFGYPGGSVLYIYDALYKHQDKINHILTCHEQGAAHAADGYARVTGKTGVVLATSGPGATNLVTGIATAYMDSVPMVAITGNVASSLIGKDSFQEVYTVGITMPITKHNFMVQDIAQLAPVLREAFRIAGTGRKGPVLVDVTKDVTMAEYDYEPAPCVCCETPAFTDDAALWEAQRLISASRKPLVCFGGGVVSCGASNTLYELLHKAQLPAVHTLMATGVLSWDDPLNMGLVGMHGNYSGNMALDNADLILAVGFRFSDRVALNTRKWAPRATVVQIEIDPSEVNKNVRAHHAVVGDLGKILEKLLPLMQPGNYAPWMAEIAAWKEQDYHPEDSADRLRPHQVIQMINDMAGEDAVLVTDVGQHQMWAAQYSRRTRPRSFLTSGGLGTMGFGYGAAIGAQMAAPGRRVVHITGDGSFHMNLNECATAVTHNLPVISVILNNQALGMVRQWQHSFYGERFSQTSPGRRTNYVKLAEGFGAKGFKADTPEEFRRVFAEALALGGPAWVECTIDKDELVLPMIPSGQTVAEMIFD